MATDRTPPHPMDAKHWEHVAELCKTLLGIVETHRDEVRDAMKLRGSTYRPAGFTSAIHELWHIAEQEARAPMRKPKA